jgi:hypothetical protein
MGLPEWSGLTLEAWLRRLADEKAYSITPRSPKEAAPRILQLQKRVKPIPRAGLFAITSIVIDPDASDKLIGTA